MTRAINKTVISVTANSKSNLEKSLYGDKKTFFWGEEILSPKTEVIRALIVTSDQARVLVPYSFFSDLANPQKVDVKEYKEGFAIEISGGTTSAPYKASIIFNSDRVAIKRKVVSPTFPDNLNQTDVFKSSFPKNM